MYPDSANRMGEQAADFGYNIGMTSTLTQSSLDQLSIDTLRLLAVDTVQKANSGHPGAPLG